MKKLAICVLAQALAFSFAAASQQTDAKPETKPDEYIEGDVKPKLSASKYFDLNLELVNVFVLRNDADFDRSEPSYNGYGQMVGFFGTFLKPMFALKLGDKIKFYYEAEIGLDLWGRNTPEKGLGSKEGTELSFKQREIWGEVFLGAFFFKAGFMRVSDVSGLFLNHWIGAARAGVGSETSSRLVLSAGQLPDQTYKGFALDGQSFKTDKLFFALDGAYYFDKEFHFDAGVYYLLDSSTVNRRRHTASAQAGLAYDDETIYGSIFFAAQFGRAENWGADNTDNQLLAFGGAAKAGIRLGPIGLEFAAAVLSADDEFSGNDEFGFKWSGKRPGFASLVNENRLRAMGDNIDLRMGSFDGSLYDMTAGLWGADFQLYYKPAGWLKAGAVEGLLGVLNPDNAYGSSFAASETALFAEAKFLEDMCRFHLTVGILVPGIAGSSKVNALSNLEATDKIYFMQAAFTLNI